MYLLLFLSFCALLMGPILCCAARKYSTLLKFVDAFIICSVFSLMAFHVLPESIAHGGLISILAASIGLFGPLLFSKIYNDNSCRVHSSLVSIASLGLISHAILEGMALASFSPNSSHQALFLGFAIVLHRLPEGVGIWRVTQSNLGKKAGILALFIVASATLGGFFFGESWFMHSSERVLMIFESLMAGVLLHIIFHRHHLIQLKPHDHSHSRTKIFYNFPLSTKAGAFCGFFLVICLSLSPAANHNHNHLNAEIAINPPLKQDMICNQNSFKDL